MLKLEWGVLVPNRWTIMEQEIYILLKLIDNQQHTQHELHQAKLKLITEWILVQVYEDKIEQSNRLYLVQVYKCIRMNWWIARQGHSKLFQDGVAQVYIRM